MRLFNLGLLLSSIFCQLARAQALPVLKDTLATRYQLPGADCALFPAAARIPSWLEKKRVLSPQRFTPTPQQATATERALRQIQLLQVNSGPKTSQDSTYARNITQRLGHYYRQYFGFYNWRKQPCVFINFIGNVAFTGEEIGLRPKPTGYVPYWLQGYVFIGDGGDDHWSIYYNLTTGKFYQYWHNLDLGGG